MRIYKKALTTVLVTLLLLSLVPSAFAEPEIERTPISAEGKSWDELVAEFIEKNNIRETAIGIGYKNLVSGEEQYYNADSYMVSGSMYKVPLNMVFAEMIYNGEITDDTQIGGYKYSFLREQTIVHSNNDMAQPMWNRLGGYNEYRRVIAPIMGEDPDTVDQMFYKNNYFTPRQMINCLSLLYSDSDRYPGVVDCMLKAEPSNYFRLKENRYTIAHKYGYLSDEKRGHFYLNDCAIVWTDEPFALVVFTDNCTKPYDILADFITVACDYTQYWTPIRLKEEEEARLEAERLAAEEEARLEAERLKEEEAARLMQEQLAAEQEAYQQAELESTLSTSKDAAEDSGVARLYFIAVAAGIILLVVFVFIRKECSLFFGVLAAALSAAALILCVRGSSAGPLRTEFNGAPEDTVTQFFDAVSAGNPDSACEYLSGCSGFGLDGADSSTPAGIITSALLSGYSYEFSGQCSAVGTDAVCAVMLSHIDVRSLCSEAENILSENQDNLPELFPEINAYDEDGNLTREIMDAAYCSALREAAADTGNNIRRDALTVKLKYSDGRWIIICDDALVSAISGGMR